MSRGDIARLTQTADAAPVTAFEFMPRPDGWLVTLVQTEMLGGTPVVTRTHRFYRSTDAACRWVCRALGQAKAEGGR